MMKLKTICLVFALILAKSPSSSFAISLDKINAKAKQKVDTFIDKPQAKDSIKEKKYLPQNSANQDKKELPKKTMPKDFAIESTKPIPKVFAEERLDSDRDGYRVANDKCWDSKLNVPVDRFGCQQYFFYSLGKVYFDLDKSKLKENEKRILNQAARITLGNPNVRKLLIEGNTDYFATIKYNNTLAQDRIKTVKQYLTSLGIPHEIISTRIRGERDPIDENWTINGRQRNRHVEVFLIELD